MKYLKDFPNVNTHIHTPYSFSSFSRLEQAFEMAVNEEIKVLGINDFYVTDGYDEFAALARRNSIFPLFNIETIALSKELQDRGIRVNDPNNPGRIYLCGKGLNYPSTIQGKCREMLEGVKTESQRQIVEMLEKLNEWLKETRTDIVLTYDEVRSRFARQLVRERHIAQALRVAIFERYTDDAQRCDALQKIYGGVPSGVDIYHEAALENELRNNLLKSGKRAFVAEDEKAFLSVEQALEIIVEAGGMPCYPVLLDDASGNITEFESNKEQLHQNLATLGIHCIELIPQRNRIDIMEPFVRFFYEKNFVVTFGTEHNAPGLTSLTPCCSGNIPLTDFLRLTNYEGACVIAAHQHLQTQGDNSRLFPRSYLTQLGDKVIRNVIY